MLSLLLALAAPSPDARLVYVGEVYVGEVYVGEVSWAGDAAEQVAYRYERRVRQEGPGRASATHVTFDAQGEPVVVQRATYEAGHALVAFDEVHGQTGVHATVRVEEDRVRLGRSRRGKVQEREEARPAAGGPVVVGPTLFGVMRDHWAALEAGEQVPIRFAVPEQLRTYRFVLSLAEGPDEAVIVEMRAASPWLRLAVRPSRLVVDRASLRVRRYVGRVPPRHPRSGRPLRARVDYTAETETIVYPMPHNPDRGRGRSGRPLTTARRRGGGRSTSPPGRSSHATRDWCCDQHPRPHALARRARAGCAQRVRQQHAGGQRRWVHRPRLPRLHGRLLRPRVRRRLR